MLISMTGFGRAEAALAPDADAVVEIRTLNHRFLETEVRLPEGWDGLEEPIRAAIGARLNRGRVRVAVALRCREAQTPVRFQAALARRYIKELHRLRRATGVSGPVTLEMVLGLPQVVRSDKPKGIPARWQGALRRSVDRALEEVVRMRRREGRRLERELQAHLKGFRLLHGRITKWVPVVQRRLARRLEERIRTAVREARGSSMPAASQAIAAEAAGFVQATDVSEELARIDSHLAALEQALAGKPAETRASKRSAGPGRTIDFLAQELQREVNTLGSKMRDGRVVRWVVELKGRIEKIREQAANVE